MSIFFYIKFGLLIEFRKYSRFLILFLNQRNEILNFGIKRNIVSDSNNYASKKKIKSLH